MFYLVEDKILDASANVVGFIHNGKFVQVKKEGGNTRVCDPLYRSGLKPIELEHISELMQKRGR